MTNARYIKRNWLETFLHRVCLRVNSHSFLWRAQRHRKPITLWMSARCERALMTQKIVRSRDAQC